MQVNVVSGGRQAFNSLLYSVPDQNTLSWLDNNVSRAKEALLGVADNLVSATETLYNKVNGFAALNAAKALLTDQGYSASQHAVYGLDHTNMGTANYVMQQYIMANPNVQQLVADNMCYGFEETYFDPEPDLVGEERSDYQRVMDGVIQETEEGVMISYYENGDDTELMEYDRFLILQTWAQVDAMIVNGDDPTEPA